jgi:hypothetical protein
MSANGLYYYVFDYNTTSGSSNPPWYIYARASLNTHFTTTPIAILDVPDSTDPSDNFHYPTNLIPDPYNNALFALYSRKIDIYNYTHGATSIGSLIASIPIGGTINSSSDWTGLLDHTDRLFFLNNTYNVVGYPAGLGYYPAPKYSY